MHFAISEWVALDSLAGWGTHVNDVLMEAPGPHREFSLYLALSFHRRLLNRDQPEDRESSNYHSPYEPINPVFSFRVDVLPFGFRCRYFVPTFGPGFCGFGVRSAIIASSQS